MGVYDSLIISCPNCNTTLEFQSKSGDCELKGYTVENIPSSVLADINRHSPITCPNCKRQYMIKVIPQIVEV